MKTRLVALALVLLSFTLLAGEAAACEGCKYYCDIIIDEIWCYELCEGTAPLKFSECTMFFPYCYTSGEICRLA